MKNDWTKISREHVLEAIEIFEASHEDYPPAKNTFLVYQGAEYPAKHIRWLVYQRALDIEVSKSDFGGGKETVNFFQKLGFETRYTPKKTLETFEIIESNKYLFKKTFKKKKNVKSGLDHNKRQNLKIGLYLQGDRDRNIRDYDRKIREASKQRLDLFVFPETCYTPDERKFESISLENKAQRNEMLKSAKRISRELGCAVIIGSEDKSGIIYNVYANAFAGSDETNNRLYYKHTYTDNSPLGNPDYGKKIDEIFEPILLKGNKIGMTICYDCTHPAISRAWGKRNVDIIINSTGGNVVNSKWSRYQKVRALENQCFTFCTMGYNRNENNGSYTYGYTPSGAKMDGIPLLTHNTKENQVNNIYIYDTSENDGRFEVDIAINQRESRNKNEHLKLDPNNLDKLIDSSVQLAEGLYMKKISDFNLVICRINDMEIIKPEIFLKKIYHESLDKFKNKKYLIVNIWDDYDTKYYDTVLSDVLKVRTVENFCAVIYKSPEKTMCFQSGNIKNVQVVSLVDGVFGLDISRMSGPESTWKNKDSMRAHWRKGYSKLISTL